MPWNTSRPHGKGVDPKYRTKQHRDQVNAYKTQLHRNGHLTCAQPVCVMPSRLILPGMHWAAGHDNSGTRYIGPVHRTCNAKDGARRARARQTSNTGWRNPRY